VIVAWHAEADAPTRWKVMPTAKEGTYIVRRVKIDFAAEVARAEREAAKRKRRRK
jgi:hypothetical protein